MKKIICVLVFVCVFLGCLSAKYVYVKKNPNERPIENILVKDKIYEKYNIPKELSMVDVTEVDDYEDVEDYIYLYNNSDVTIKEASVYVVGTYMTRAYAGHDWFWGNEKSESSIGMSEKPILVGIVKNIEPWDDKGIDISNTNIMSFRYLIVSIDEPENSRLKVTYAEEKHDDLRLFITR